MTFWSELFRERHLISRTFYGVPGTQTITAPAKAAYIRVSGVGAGGSKTNGFGYGAAFARTKTTCAPGDQYSVQVGDIAHSLDAGDAAGDSKVTKVSGSVVIMKAERGKGTAAGSSANCTGDVKRSGSAPSGNTGGAAAGDDADPFPLGFGGRGGAALLGPMPGGGGAKNYAEYSSGAYTFPWTIPAGGGRLCVEFFDQDPGY